MLFTATEHQERLARCRAVMAADGYDHLLVLEPENVSYLTGFYTEGFNTSFQCAIISSSGDPVVVSRTAEKYWLEQSCRYADQAVLWSDGETPVEATVRAAKEVGMTSGTVGVEMASWRADANYVARLTEAVTGVQFVNAGDRLSQLRFVKSTAELGLIRRAGVIADGMMRTAVAEAYPGNTERGLAAAVASFGMRAGNDMAHPGPISSGEAAKHIHATYTDRRFEADDVVFAEVTPHVRNYHARMMRSIVIGRPDPAQVDLAQRLVAVQDRALAEVRDGVDCRVPDRVYREGILDTGAVAEYPNKTFYSVGLLLLPHTLEPLEVNAATAFAFEAGMVFHSYLAVAGVNLSETIVVTDTGYERVTNFPRELVLA